MPHHPRLSREQVIPPDERAVVEQACRLLELKSHDARCLHSHANTVYLLPAENAVIRLQRGSFEHNRRAIILTRWLIDQGFPSTEPLEGEQPVLVGSWTATSWQYYDQRDRPPPEPWQLGGLLRQLHALPTPPLELPRYAPLTNFARQVRRTEFLADGDRAWLLDRAEELLVQYDRLEFPLGHGHIHGDAYPGNLLWDGERALLGDWDEASVGPRELDLVNTYQGARFGRTEAQLGSFAESYGHDVSQWPGFATLRATRDLHTLTAYLGRGDRGDLAAQRQVMHRVGTLQRGDLTALWESG